MANESIGAVLLKNTSLTENQLSEVSGFTQSEGRKASGCSGPRQSKFR